MKASSHHVRGAVSSDDDDDDEEEEGESQAGEQEKGAAALGSRAAAAAERGRAADDAWERARRDRVRSGGGTSANDPDLVGPCSVTCPYWCAAVWSGAHIGVRVFGQWLGGVSAQRPRAWQILLATS